MGFVTVSNVAPGQKISKCKLSLAWLEVAHKLVIWPRDAVTVLEGFGQALGSGPMADGMSTAVGHDPPPVHPVPDPWIP